MSIYLKSAVQNLDAHIMDLTEIRNKLAGLLTGELHAGRPEAGATATVQTIGLPPVTQGGEDEITKKIRKLRKLAKLKKRNGGGRKGKKDGGGQLGGLPATPTESNAVNTAPRVQERRPVTVSGGPVSTLSAAMKVEIARLQSFTLEQLQTVVAEKYGSEDFYKNMGGSAFYGNLSYWAKTGKLEKTGDGAQSSFKVLDKEFFERVGG